MGAGAGSVAVAGVGVEADAGSDGFQRHVVRSSGAGVGR